MKRVAIFYRGAIISMIAFSVTGKESRKAEKIKQIVVGNFALSGSQQPGPLFSFGQNIVDKGVTELFTYVDRFKGSHFSFNSLLPAVLYGITNRLSVFVEVPFATSFKVENCSSRGPQDFRLQFEGAAYIAENSTIINEITLVANMAVPTGSVTTNPPLGLGAPSFFLGFTASQARPYWWYFVSSGVLLPTSHKNNKYGNQFLYQGGLGRNITYSPDKWIFNGLIELNGMYAQRNKFSGLISCNSGGNTLFVGPSLWFSTRRLILQMGISVAVFQHLFGVQPKESYIIAAGICWKF